MKRSVILFLALCTAGCGLFGSNPRKTVSKYLDAVVRGKFEDAYPRISSKDRAMKSLEKYASENAESGNPLVKALAGKSRYEIKEVAVEGDRARVTVAFTHPDLGSQSAGAVAVVFASARPRNLDTGEAGRVLAEAYQGKAIQETTTLQTFSVVRDPDGWKVRLGWDAQALLAQAQQLRQEGKLSEALEAYERALQLDPQSTEAVDGKDEVVKQIHDVRVTQTYLENNVELVGFKVVKGRGRNGAGTSVSGRILNNGHRSLGEVEVTVYFLSQDGKVLDERKFRPVPAQEITYYGEERSLRRGGVKEFGYIVDGALPAGWQGRAQAMVTKILFEDKT